MSEITQKLGIQDIKEVVTFGFKAREIGVHLFQGGSFHAEKLGELIQLYPVADAAINGYENIIPQFKDLDSTEAAELTAHAVSLGISDEHATKVIDESLEVAIHAYKLFQCFQK